tara:strand:- start:1130 stop:1813 length:684 start_codon:yes stop_codon:yes gene_type:complete
MIRRIYPPIIIGKLRESIKLVSDDFFYNDLVKEVEGELINFIFGAREKGDREAEFDFVWPYPVDPEIFDNEYSSMFLINIMMRPENNISGQVNVSGNAGQGPDGFATIDIKIEHRPDIDNEDVYEDLVGQLRNTLAHEMHHLTQSEPLKRPDCPELPEQEGGSHKDYFISACEIPSFVVGFRAEAEYKDMPIDELMKVYLGNYEKIGAITPQESKDVLYTWLDYKFG